MADFTLQDLQDQNDVLLSQLEITRLNSDELREQMSLIKKTFGLNTLGREQLLKINQANRDLSNLNKSLIDQLKERNNLERPLVTIEKDLVKSKNIQRSLITELLELRKKSNALNGPEKQHIDDLISGLESQIDSRREIEHSLQEELRLTNMIGDKMGMIPSIAEGISKSLDKLGFGSLSKRLDIDGAVFKTKEWLVANEGNKNKFQIISKFSGELFGNITKTLGPIALLGAALTMIVKAMSNFDTMTGETAKSMGISYEQASKINQELTQVAATSSNTFITTKSLVEAQNALNTSLGTSAQLNGEMLTTYTELTKQAGYSNEAAEQLYKLRLITGKPEKEIAATYLGQVKALNLKKGLAINEKALLNDISNISKATLITFSKNPAELAKAAFEVKKIGLGLKEIEGIQNSLLDIESSIASEFEAEVMTGKSLNLERARYYALTNDISGLSQEIAKQGITSASFGDMNVLQQESIAKAMGMSRDEMGNMLMEQEALSKLGMTDNEENRKKLKYLTDHGGSLSSIVKLGKEEYARQLKSTTTQERFLALTEKLQEVFVSMAGPIMSIVSPIVDTLFPVLTTISGTFRYILESVSKIFGLFTGSTEQLTIWESLIGSVVISLGIAKTLQQASAMYSTIRAAAEASSIKSLAAQGVLMVKNLGVAIATAVSQMTGMSAATLGIATAIGLAGGAAAYGYLKSMDDGMVGPDGGMILSGPKGSIQLNKDDSVIAGTDLMGGQKSEGGNVSSLASSLNNKDDSVIAGTDLMGGQKSEGGNVSSLASSLNNKLDQLISEIRVMSGELKKGMTVNLDGNKVSQELLTPLAISNRRI